MAKLEFLKWKMKRLKKRAAQLQNQAEDLNAMMVRDGAIYGGLALRYTQVCDHLEHILGRIESILKEIERLNNVQN